MTRWAGLILIAMSLSAFAEEQIAFCHNWSCAGIVSVEFAESFLNDIGALMRDADSAAQERELLAVALGRIYGWAGEHSVLGADRAGNTDDADIDGRMDCIDHSNNTTTILGLFERRGWLRFHRVVEPRFRHRFFVLPVHRSAVIEALPTGPVAVGDDLNEALPDEQFAVDSWLVDPGRPVVVLPLDDWLRWGGPYVQ